MAREITTKFKSCLEDDTLQKETIIFKTEDGTELGQVNLRQLKRGEFEEWQSSTNKSPEEFLLKAIESWTFKDKDGQVLSRTLENIKGLTSAKKVENIYAIGILEELFKIAVEMNVVTEQDEKNSVKQKFCAMMTDLLHVNPITQNWGLDVPDKIARRMVANGSDLYVATANSLALAIKSLSPRYYPQIVGLYLYMLIGKFLELRLAQVDF
jgi:hypothetical protein